MHSVIRYCIEYSYFMAYINYTLSTLMYIVAFPACIAHRCCVTCIHKHSTEAYAQGPSKGNLRWAWPAPHSDAAPQIALRTSTCVRLCINIYIYI